MAEIQCGDKIFHRGEIGIVTCTNPFIMRVLAFHSYVPVLGACEILMLQAEPGVSMKPEIVDRIRNYLIENDLAETPTGAFDVGKIKGEAEE